MKRIMFIAMLFVGLSTMAFAQSDGSKRGDKTPEERAQHSADMLAKKLQLTETQKSQVYALNLESFKNFKARKESGEKVDRSAWKAAKDAHEQKINDILNENQRKAYVELKAERREKVKHHNGKERKPQLKSDKKL